jgi:hypothetical protein
MSWGRKDIEKPCMWRMPLAGMRRFFYVRDMNIYSSQLTTLVWCLMIYAAHKFLLWPFFYSKNFANCGKTLTFV